MNVTVNNFKRQQSTNLNRLVKKMSEYRQARDSLLRVRITFLIVNSKQRHNN